MLNEIGLTRVDMASVQYGGVTLEQLDAGGKASRPAAEQHGRAIRAKSIIALFAAIKQRISVAVEAYRVRAQARRGLQTLLNLSDPYA